MNDFVTEVRRALAAMGDPKRAKGQQAYMKSEMPYHGVLMPQIRKLIKVLGKSGDWDVTTIEQQARILWDQATHREERYVSIGLTGFPAATGKLELVELFEYQVRTGLWWDYTDDIAHRIRELHDAHPTETGKLVRQWSQGDTFWLRRLAIISQLRRGNRTDVALLTQVIEENAADKEFFIRKGIGWALRDYAYTDPDWVRSFVASHELSPLTRREALKHL